MKTKHHTWALCDHTYGHTCFPKVGGLWGQLAAHLVARSLDGGVVLDLPQPLAEPFPLVGLAKLLLGLLVREEVFGAQECPGERWETVLSSPSLHLSCAAPQARGAGTTALPPQPALPPTSAPSPRWAEEERIIEKRACPLPLMTNYSEPKQQPCWRKV